jgi:uncharacterized membrane protein YphA (DoxX/SURF4 family)
LPLTLNLDPAQHKEHPLQRFFSTFPRSWPGAGLLLLRTVAGGAAVAQGALYLALGVPSTPASWALALLPIAGGLALIAGFLTPAAGVVAGLATLCVAVTWSPSPVPAFFIDRLPALLVLADAAALTMLGPGAYSLDARLFGRREILVVRRDDPRH